MHEMKNQNHLCGYDLRDSNTDSFPKNISYLFIKPPPTLLQIKEVNG